MKLIADIQYFPSIIYYVDLIRSSDIFIDPYDPYKKMSFRNRTLIAGANGVIILSVPLDKGRDQKGPVKDIKIANRDKWQLAHWKTLLSCYNRSPWFEHYRDELIPLYQKQYTFLLDWDLACLEWTLLKLGLPYKVRLSSIDSQTDEKEDARDGRNMILPKNYQDFKPLIYRQVFEESLGFLPNLSILDLLFCEGKQSGHLLKQHAVQ